MSFVEAIRCINFQSWNFDSSQICRISSSLYINAQFVKLHTSSFINILTTDWITRKEVMKKIGIKFLVDAKSWWWERKRFTQEWNTLSRF